MQQSKNELLENIPTAICHVDPISSLKDDMKLKITAFDKIVVGMLASGLKIKDIADRLNKNYHTISGIVEDMRIKVEAKNTAQLVAIFMCLDFIKYEPHIPALEEKNNNRPPSVYSNHSALKIAK